MSALVTVNGCDELFRTHKTEWGFSSTMCTNVYMRTYIWIGESISWCEEIVIVITRSINSIFVIVRGRMVGGV